MEDIPDAMISRDTAGDPYHFRVGDTHITLSFDANGPALEDAVTRYFTALKQGALP